MQEDSKIKHPDFPPLITGRFFSSTFLYDGHTIIRSFIFIYRGKSLDKTPSPPFPSFVSCPNLNISLFSHLNSISKTCLLICSNVKIFLFIDVAVCRNWPQILSTPVGSLLPLMQKWGLFLDSLNPAEPSDSLW